MSILLLLLIAIALIVCYCNKSNMSEDGSCNYIGSFGLNTVGSHTWPNCYYPYR